MYNFDFSSLFESPLCQDDIPSILDGLEFSDLDSQSNEIKTLNQPKALGNHHLHNNDPTNVCGDDFLGTSANILIYHEDFLMSTYS